MWPYVASPFRGCRSFAGARPGAARHSAKAYIRTARCRIARCQGGRDGQFSDQASIPQGGRCWGGGLRGVPARRGAGSVLLPSGGCSRRGPAVRARHGVVHAAGVPGGPGHRDDQAPGPDPHLLQGLPSEDGRDRRGGGRDGGEGEGRRPGPLCRRCHLHEDRGGSRSGLRLREGRRHEDDHRRADVRARRLHEPQGPGVRHPRGHSQPRSRQPALPHAAERVRADCRHGPADGVVHGHRPHPALGRRSVRVGREVRRPAARRARQRRVGVHGQGHHGRDRPRRHRHPEADAHAEADRLQGHAGARVREGRERPAAGFRGVDRLPQGRPRGARLSPARSSGPGFASGATSS